MSRHILYLYLPSFAIEVERVLHASYRNRPVVLAPQSTERSKIWEVSGEAMQQGVKAGMPLTLAKRHCRDLVVIDPRPDLYSKIHRHIEEKILQSFSPLYELEKWGHYYLDMSGAEMLFGPPQDMARRIQRQLKQDFSLEGILGGAVNKLVSKVAAQIPLGAAGENIRMVDKGREALFLRPLPVDVLPLVEVIKKGGGGGGGRGEDVFLDLRLEWVEDLVELSVEAATVAFGSWGPQILQMGQGIDSTPVFPPRREPAILEEVVLERDTNDEDILRTALFSLLQRAIRRLSQQNLMAQEMRLSLRYADFKVASSLAKMKKEKAGEDLSRGQLPFQDVLFPLLRRTMKRRTRIRSLSLHFTSLWTLNWGPPPTAGPLKILNIMEGIKNRFGEKSITFANEVIFHDSFARPFPLFPDGGN